jgi:cysteinyl-tRNA synthetase
MREIRLHDTRTGELLELQPRDPGRVGIYACGPTVYSRIHIGNARPFVVFSLLERFLEHEGYDVTFVMNVTDVNDKIYDAARARAGRGEGSRAVVAAVESGQAASSGASREADAIDSAKLALEMTAHYVADTDALGLGRPGQEPLASETMGPIVSYIKDLIDSGHAYASGGDVFFRVRSDADYGSLSHRRIEDMDQGEGVEGADRKEDPLDFALWKARKHGEDTWWDPADFVHGTPSDWGVGRPGWHIECSAMAESLLGAGFDIHGGGADLVFPHHENEASQTRAARGEELARIWMHNGMVQMTGEKMAKSVGNIAPLHEVLERCGAQAVVMYLISGHYRQPLAFSDDALDQAIANVKRIREAARRLGGGPAQVPGSERAQQLDDLRLAFFDALANDFNTPLALAQLNEWLRRASQLGVAGTDDLREMLGVLGLEGLLAGDAQAPTGVQELAAQRELARARRDFAAADELRERIAALGWEVRDGAQGFELLPL